MAPLQLLLCALAASVAIGVTVTRKITNDRLQNSVSPCDGDAGGLRPSMTTLRNGAEGSVELGMLPGRAGNLTMMAVELVDSSGAPIKAALSAYMHFCAERRPALTQELKASMGAEFKNTMVMSGLGDEWKALGAEDKAKFEAVAKADKERYDAAVASNPDNELRKASKSTNKTAQKFVDSSGAPIKAAVSAYMHFCAERRPALTQELKASMGSEFKNPMVMSGLGDEWKALGEEDKAKFEAVAKADKERYDAAVASNPDNALMKKKTKKASSGPKKLSAYMCFCNDRRPSVTASLKESMGSEFKNTAVMTELGAMWKALDETEQRLWKALAEGDPVATSD